MYKSLLLALVCVGLLTSCGNSEELERLRKENTDLKAQLDLLNAAKKPKYILKLKLKQASFSLSVKKHIRNAMNAIEFELPVDKDFYDSVSEGTEIVDKFRFGSLVLYGTLGDWEMTVRGKEIRE
ncbi:MAG: ELKS/Rab6-interacting/CAST family protein [Bacteroidetes bacterium]|nr:ELKS/Rab6-interacting/CAST family protein [Bacteroidota bacterium]